MSSSKSPRIPRTYVPDVSALVAWQVKTPDFLASYLNRRIRLLESAERELRRISNFRYEHPDDKASAGRLVEMIIGKSFGDPVTIRQGTRIAAIADELKTSLPGFSPEQYDAIAFAQFNNLTLVTDVEKVRQVAEASGVKVTNSRGPVVDWLNEGHGHPAKEAESLYNALGERYGEKPRVFTPQNLAPPVDDKARKHMKNNPISSTSSYSPPPITTDLDKQVAFKIRPAIHERLEGLARTLDLSKTEVVSRLLLVGAAEKLNTPLENWPNVNSDPNLSVDGRLTVGVGRNMVAAVTRALDAAEWKFRDVNGLPSGFRVSFLTEVVVSSLEKVEKNPTLISLENIGRINEELGDLGVRHDPQAKVTRTRSKTDKQETEKPKSKVPPVVEQRTPGGARPTLWRALRAAGLSAKAFISPELTDLVKALDETRKQLTHNLGGEELRTTERIPEIEEKIQQLSAESQEKTQARQFTDAIDLLLEAQKGELEIDALREAQAVATEAHFGIAKNYGVLWAAIEELALANRDIGDQKPEAVVHEVLQDLASTDKTGAAERAAKEYAISVGL